jgi:transposase InsO family protein
MRSAIVFDMKALSFEYIGIFYNRIRQHAALGDLSPAQYLERCKQQQEKQAT